jgi:ribosome recycling factor
MLLKELLNEVEKKMDSAVEGTRHECAGIRTGRASIALVDGINVEAYGGKSPIRQMANISTPDARTIVIQPWDKGILKSIEKAIQTSDLGVTPSNDGNVIRLTLPQLTQERRQELAKQVKKLGEEGKISVRNVRRHAIDEIKQGEKDGDIPEDEGKATRDKIDKQVEEHSKRIDAVIHEKTEEIMKF